MRETAVRIRTGPAHGLDDILNSRREDERILGGWTLLEVQARKRDGYLLTPPGSLAETWESRCAFIRVPWQAPPEVVINERERTREAHYKIT